ncbi:MAG: hypothetical protein OES32_19235 [Acidobacteriota bacterium]|nr:hypothetical protein [Acidobacteriota bacterium]MDH3525710.1 hypothetical protein [Acidobacteriota bacterium]
MRDPRASRSSGPASRLGLGALAVILAWLAPAAVAAAVAGWRTLPEMEPPGGVVVDPAGIRAGLAASVEGAAAVVAVERAVRRDWRKLQDLDWEALSRYQRAATAGWRLPASPGPLVGRVLGRDGGGRLHVEVRGPRLPAAFDIVHRYVYVFAAYDPLTGEVAGLTATIRGWVEE